MDLAAERNKKNQWLATLFGFVCLSNGLAHFCVPIGSTFCDILGSQMQPRSPSTQKGPKCYQNGAKMMAPRLLGRHLMRSRAPWMAIWSFLAALLEPSWRHLALIWTTFWGKASPSESMKNIRKTQVFHGLEAPGCARSAPDGSIWEVWPTKMGAQRTKREVREIKVGPISSKLLSELWESMGIGANRRNTEANII